MDIDTICRAAVALGASDIHIKTNLPPLVRIDGDIQPIPKAPRLTPDVIGKMAWAIMSPVQREHFKVHNDLDMAHSVAQVGRFRVNVFRQRGAIGLVLRAIPNKVKTIDDMALPKVLKTLAEEKRGLILLTGATGSGKSTTLAALIEEINRRHPYHVLTIEDPIEFAFTDRKSVINQREVGNDTTSFHSALRAALRQDPDVILLGELRDKETMEIAMSAAETGHLVLGTLHTINAAEAIQRIVGFFEPHHQEQIRKVLSGIIVGIISQRLVPRKGGGRVAAVEIMLNRGAITECIADGDRVKEIPDLITKGAGQYQMQSFDQSLFWSFQRDQITEEALMTYASNPDDLQLRMNGIASEDWPDPEG
ncbi:MAG: type IV pilus twitching motility protein PilT [Alphaproteobacteria bacterium]|nr:type IV pilus twitching motility protein PilT [Alphaproteobacteria bacterium]MCB9795962.1 type IV pilus twitching motility protein PilT [Alphaproteobacteria bacterium]